MENLTYHQRLRILELDSLELRRVRADLLFTYKLVFGLRVNVQWNTTFRCFNCCWYERLASAVGYYSVTVCQYLTQLTTLTTVR